MPTSLTQIQSPPTSLSNYFSILSLYMFHKYVYTPQHTLSDPQHAIYCLQDFQTGGIITNVALLKFYWYFFLLLLKLALSLRFPLCLELPLNPRISGSPSGMRRELCLTSIHQQEEESAGGVDCPTVSPGHSIAVKHRTSTEPQSNS